MTKYFVDEITDDEAVITGLDARHIATTRGLGVGDKVTVCAYGMDYTCTITSVTSQEVRLSVESSAICVAEPNVSLTLYQANPKAEKLVEIIQKSVELGASKIVPFLSERCVSHPNVADFDRKLFRLQKIAKSAAKQSGRGIVPEVSRLHTLEEVCAEIQLMDHVLFLYEGGGRRFSEISFQGMQDIAIIVGSEGGFSPREAEQILEIASVTPVWMGERILRCETAPLAAISIIMERTGNL